MENTVFPMQLFNLNTNYIFNGFKQIQVMFDRQNIN